MRRAGLVLAAVLLVSACSGGNEQQALADGTDPIAALGSTALSTRYTEAYWAREADADHYAGTALWMRAITLCSPNANVAEPLSDKPNCGTVRQARYDAPARRPFVPRAKQPITDFAPR